MFNFQYVHTTSDVLTRDKPIRRLIEPYVNNYLFSLYNLLSNEKVELGEFCAKSKKKIRPFFNSLSKENFVIDSGGYSIITGDIPYSSISYFISEYLNFMEHEMDYYDYIMSLDIPIFLNEPQYNNYSNIYTLNSYVTYESSKLLQKYPQLENKLVFVWHFKLRKQFDIWTKIYNESFANSNIKHFSIGGLVGLRAAANIKFSPFLVPLYRNLKLLYDKNTTGESLLHVLGVYSIYDRFTMAFLSKLFNDHYLKDRDHSVKITYDTSSFTLDGIREVMKFNFFNLLENESFIKYSGITPDIRKLIRDEDICERVITERENLLNRTKRSQVSPVLTPMTNIIYNMIIDYVIEKFIHEEDLINTFLENPTFHKFRKAFLSKYQIGMKKYPYVLNGIYKHVLNNFQWICPLHDLWQRQATLDKYDKAIDKYIEAINFPFDIN